MSESASRRPPVGRYGPEPTARGRRGKAIAWSVAGAGVLGLVVWIGTGVWTDPVDWNDVGYSVQGPDRIEVTFEVIKDPAATARCTVHALNSGYTEVGVVRQTLGPTQTRLQRHTVTVATQELAVTGLVDSCELVPDGTQ